MTQPSSTPSHLAIYLVHYYAPIWCARAARSLLKSEGIIPLVTIIDNGGGQDLERMVPPQVRVLKQEINRGFTGGANVAFHDWKDRSTGDSFILIGSHDLHLDPGALYLLLKAAAAHPECGILAPNLIGREHRMPVTQDIHDGVGHVPWVSGTCMLFRKECLRAVRGFDETYGSYVEDVDICLRAADAGWLTGVVVGSHGFGLGRAHPDVGDVLCDANKILLTRRRGGTLRFYVAAAALLGRTVRSALGCIWPFRPLEARKRSRLMLVRRLRALLRVARTYRTARTPQLPAG